MIIINVVVMYIMGTCMMYSISNLCKVLFIPYRKEFV